MKNLCSAALAALLLITSSPAVAQEAELVIETADDVVLSEFKWTNRVLVVFADSPLDPNFSEQIALLTARPLPLVARDVVVLTDTDPDTPSEVRRTLRPRGFALVLVDKDGRVMLRKPDAWDVREISRAIDKTPLRQQEIREGL
ncbi:DUF4174 domain-containing protein [Celeribacter indicus]|uniref:DUF4174 domain-containing protein n=1 Tax=Celeribacter indicus TaxID=1208324 RepID=A0A0B5DYL0_9RHOB|nr:DUF4174 domain-containing protein [Celeribacter indicus]AJE48084.1 hypothetical protein P73_3369 [Celeribacter indicus]SDW32235.1 protein of unknown function [Celeribacter indicus]